MTYDEQLDRWVAGASIHNQELGVCCPDFSCCKPELLAPKEVREVFAAASKAENEAVITRMLMEFLGRALALLPGVNAHIAGLEASRQEVAG